jgi:response regulator RpfG family c-di-GMP phosphodiesterase
MHVKRVAEYSKLLATFYGLPKEEIETVKMASPMHDIGKIGIPDAILIWIYLTFAHPFNRCV